MTNKEILEKAIQKAIDGGLAGYWADRYRDCVELEELAYLTDGNNIDDGETVEKLIYNRDFAKALWGEWSDAERGALYPEIYELERWQLYLQAMVIADDPIKYLGENI